MIREELHEVLFFSLTLRILLETEFELPITVQIHGPSPSKLLLDHLLEESGVGGALAVGGGPGGSLSRENIHHAKDVLVAMKRVITVDEEIHLQVRSRSWGGDARVDLGFVDLAMHLVDWLLPVPVFDLRLGDVSHGRIEACLLGQLVAVHEPCARRVKQATEGGLL